jgi:hypothetical protein
LHGFWHYWHFLNIFSIRLTDERRRRHAGFRLRDILLRRSGYGGRGGYLIEDGCLEEWPQIRTGFHRSNS